jgi:hypothetical protein
MRRLPGVCTGARHGFKRLERARPLISSRFCLFQPELHVHLAVHHRRGGEVLVNALGLAHLAEELAKAEVAVRDERAHAAGLGQPQRFAVVGLAALGVELVRMGRDVAEQVQCVGRGPVVRSRIFDRTVAPAPRLVEPAEQQTGTTQRMVGRADLVEIAGNRVLEDVIGPNALARLDRDG